MLVASDNKGEPSVGPELPQWTLGEERRRDEVLVFLPCIEPSPHLSGVFFSYAGKVCGNGNDGRWSEAMGRMGLWNKWIGMRQGRCCLPFTFLLRLLYHSLSVTVTLKFYKLPVFPRHTF